MGTVANSHLQQQQSTISSWQLTVALCSVANFINSADRVIMPITIIQMADAYSWSLHDQGVILSAFSVGYLASMIAGGSAARLYGGKLILTLAVFLWSLSTFLAPLCANWFGALVLCRVLLGIGEGLGLPSIFHLFSLRVPAEMRSTAFGYLVAFGSAGQTVAALACPHLPWQLSFYSFGCAGLFWALAWLLFYREAVPSSVLQQQQRLFAERQSKTMTQSGGDDSGSSSIYAFDSQGASSVRWIEFISHWPLWAIYIAHFTMNWSNYIIMNWLPTYLSKTLGADKNQIMFTAVPYILNSFVGIGAGYFSDTLIRERWTALSVRRLMTFIGLVGPGLLILLFAGSNSIALAVLFISLSMGLSACNSSGHLANHAEVAPGHAGITFAVSNALATIPGVLCGPLTAELVTKSSGRWFPVYILAGLMNLVGAIVYVSQSSATQVL